MAVPETIGLPDGADELVARFRDAWRAGQRPRLEDWLAASTEPESDLLRHLLLAAELRERRRLGEEPTPADYRGRLDLRGAELTELFGTATETWSPGPSAIDGLIGRVLGDYRILAAVGRGGMGRIYRAEHCWLKRTVALKVLPPGVLDAEAAARFEREMLAIGRLEHPNIVRCNDARRVDGTLLLVMDLVDGVDLGVLVGRLGPLPVADACELIRQAAVGLQHANERGLVHRDIKPSNLMLARDGVVRVLDLGLALVLDAATTQDDLTAPLQVMGTGDYMAPEQWEDAHRVDTRADVYGLGCTLYQLLTGTPPFRDPSRTSRSQKMAAHLHEPVPPLRRTRDDVPTELEAVLRRMLAKAPADRVSTPGEVAIALGRFSGPSDLPRLLRRLESAATSDRDGPAAVPLPPPEPAPPTAKIDEDVQFTVYRPRVVAPARWSSLLVFAHHADRPPDAPADEPAPIEVVRDRAARLLGPEVRSHPSTTQDSAGAVPRDGLLRFVPTAEGLEFNPRLSEFHWTEPIHQAEFRFRAAAILDGRTARGRLSVFLGSLLLAEVALSIRVDSAAEHGRVRFDEPETARPFRRIYASFSVRDRPIVEQVERFARLIGDDYLSRYTAVRAGEVWDDRLAELIAEADVFQLFWSRNALASPIVEREWRHALALERPQFIRPVYWEVPLPSDPNRDLPPAALRRLAFQRLDGVVPPPVDESPSGPELFDDLESESGSDFELTPSSVIDALQPESGSDFELMALDGSDELSAETPKPSESDLSGAEPSTPGINLGKPSDSGINLQRMGSLEDADSIELAPLEDDDAPKKPAPKPAVAENRPDPSATALPTREGQKDIFEDTDFEVDALDSDADDTIQLEAQSDFDLDESDSASEVFALDEEDVDQNAAAAMGPEVLEQEDTLDAVLEEEGVSDLMEDLAWDESESEESGAIAPTAPAPAPARTAEQPRLAPRLAVLSAAVVLLIVLALLWWSR